MMLEIAWAISATDSVGFYWLAFMLIAPAAVGIGLYLEHRAKHRPLKNPITDKDE